MAKTRVVRDASELLDAVGSDATDIEVQGTIAGMPMITLRPGVTLRGGVLEFGAKGVRLTSHNTLEASPSIRQRTRSRSSTTPRSRSWAR